MSHLMSYRVQKPVLTKHYTIDWPNANVDGDVVIGFVKLGLDNTIAEEKDWPVYFLWRIMMGTEYLGKGYGNQKLDLFVQKCKEEERKNLYVFSKRIETMRVHCISNMDLKMQN